MRLEVKSIKDICSDSHGFPNLPKTRFPSKTTLCMLMTLPCFPSHRLYFTGWSCLRVRKIAQILKDICYSFHLSQNE